MGGASQGDTPLLYKGYQYQREQSEIPAGTLRRRTGFTVTINTYTAINIRSKVLEAYKAW